MTKLTKLLTILGLLLLVSCGKPTDTTTLSDTETGEEITTEVTFDRTVVLALRNSCTSGIDVDCRALLRMCENEGIQFACDQHDIAMDELEAIEKERLRLEELEAAAELERQRLDAIEASTVASRHFVWESCTDVVGEVRCEEIETDLFDLEDGAQVDVGLYSYGVQQTQSNYMVLERTIRSRTDNRGFFTVKDVEFVRIWKNRDVEIWTEEITVNNAWGIVAQMTVIVENPGAELRIKTNGTLEIKLETEEFGRYIEIQE